jgi:hypothetical protein
MLLRFGQYSSIPITAAGIVLAAVLTLGCTRKDSEIKTGIRAVDFANFTYFPSCNGNQSGPVKVKDRTIQNNKIVDGVNEPIDENLPNYFDLGEPVYGDLDGDGKEEAVIQSECNMGGTANFDEGYIFAMKDGTPVLVARVEGGDRGMGGIANLKIVENRLVLTRNESSVNCCAEFTVTTSYRLKGNKLVVVGTPERRKVDNHD